jgi:hypothetical protein
VFTAETSNLEQVIGQLSGSDRGRNAMRRILDWMDDDGLGLDMHNQTAALSLIAAAWRFPGSARDAIREAISEQCEHGVRDGEYCRPCNRAYRQAELDNGS